MKLRSTRPLHLVSLVLASAVVSESAQACRVMRGFSEETMATATNVVRAEVVDYVLQSNANIVVITIKVLETLRGKANATQRLVWQNSTFGVPKDLEEFKRFSLGPLLIGYSASPADLPAAWTTDPKWREVLDLPWITQAPCAPPFMFDEARGDAAIVEMLRSQGLHK